jgi:hypothetical protein
MQKYIVLAIVIAALLVLVQGVPDIHSAGSPSDARPADDDVAVVVSHIKPIVLSQLNSNSSKFIPVAYKTQVVRNY